MMQRKLIRWIPVLTVLMVVFGGTVSMALPPVGYNKVAYYAFDATPVDQGILSLTEFTDNANIVVVFEGTLWELADTVHYDTRWMRNKVYKSKKQILDDIGTLQERGVLVLMNVDDAASWSTDTPFTTWDGVKLDYRQFAAFVDSCVKVVGFDGISLDVEHKAVDNAQYRNLIKELGKYFGPVSPDSLTTIYTAAVYYGKYGAPGPIFREEELYRNFNFLMEMGYTRDNMERFNYWAASAGNSRVMVGMSHQDNDLSDAVKWAEWHPEPEKAGVMVFAANVNKPYSDSIFAALGDEKVGVAPQEKIQPQVPLTVVRRNGVTEFRFSLKSKSQVSLRLVSADGRISRRFMEKKWLSGNQTVSWDDGDNITHTTPGLRFVVLTINGTSVVEPCILF